MSIKPSLQEGLKVTACSAALEGIVDGGISILEHKQERGKIRYFEKEDWKKIGIDTAKGVGKGAIRGAAVYAATNVAHVPVGIASATVTGAFGVVENSSRYIKGECTGKAGTLLYKVAKKPITEAVKLLTNPALYETRFHEFFPLTSPKFKQFITAPPPKLSQIPPDRPFPITLQKVYLLTKCISYLIILKILFFVLN